MSIGRKVFTNRVSRRQSEKWADQDQYAAYQAQQGAPQQVPQGAAPQQVPQGTPQAPQGAPQGGAPAPSQPTP